MSWVGFELLHRTFQLGLTERDAQRLQKWMNEIADAGHVHMSTLEEGLGRVMYVAGALEYGRPFLSPLCRFLVLHTRNTVQRLLTYVIFETGPRRARLPLGFRAAPCPYSAKYVQEPCRASPVGSPPNPSLRRMDSQICGGHCDSPGTKGDSGFIDFASVNSFLDHGGPVVTVANAWCPTGPARTGGRDLQEEMFEKQQGMV